LGNFTVVLFLGMFIAKISRGRTIKEYINGTMTAPVLYSFMWLVVFGGQCLSCDNEVTYSVSLTVDQSYPSN